MPTSELSNALNPYVTQDRHRQPVTEYSTPLQQVTPIPQNYAPHRSELELAISEPQPPALPPPSRPPTLKPRGQFSQEGVTAVQEFIRLIATTREAQEIERKRRLAWEQEQEAKQAQRQAETERSMLEMRQEIQSLRAMLSRNSRMTIIPQLSPQTLPSAPTPQQPTASITGLFTPHYTLSPAVPEQSIPQHPSAPTSPTPIGQPQTVIQSTFVQGPSTMPYSPNSRHSSDLSLAQETRQHISYAVQSMQSRPHYRFQGGAIDQQQQMLLNHAGGMRQLSSSVEQSATPSPSPQLSVLHPPTDSSTTSRKRKTSEMASDDDSNFDSDGSDATPVQRIRRVNHHDRRCLTIQHAMRLQFLRCMDLDTDKQLPDSHVEGAVLEDTQPVRFVWDKTTKQSTHNGRMKSRILSNIKTMRSLYRHVPDKEFGKKSLDGAFEQCFTTFRHKFRAQRDMALAANMKQKEDIKARRSRHLSRRKLKLSNRADARQKLKAFEHVIFDGAFHLDCMSSEDSDDELVSSPKSNGILRTHGYAWRSARLIRFYCILDEEERVDKSTKPKRGVGKKDRCIGPPKEGFHLPPEGVATWMISRKWINTMRREVSELPELLSKLTIDRPGFNWEHFEALGAESGEDGEGHELQRMQMHAMQMDYTGSSSFNYALMQ